MDTELVEVMHFCWYTQFSIVRVLNNRRNSEENGTMTDEVVFNSMLAAQDVHLHAVVPYILNPLDGTDDKAFNNIYFYT